MAKTIKIKYDEKEYILEFTRSSVVSMEKNGFDFTELSGKPMTRFPQLFAGAFLAKHKTLKQSEIDKIFDALNGKEQFLSALVEMYNETLSTLIGKNEEEQEDKNEGNAIWEMS